MVRSRTHASLQQDPHRAPRYPQSETIYVYPVEGFILPRTMEIAAVRTHEVRPAAKGGQKRTPAGQDGDSDTRFAAYVF